MKTAHEYKLLGFLLLLVAGLYLPTTIGIAIVDDGDALYAHAAQQMLARGDWVTPYANNVRHLDKPPLPYWLMGVASAVFGVGEFATRLPSALAVIGTGWLLFLFGNRGGGAQLGFVSGLAGTLCVGTFLFTRMAYPDIFLVFFLTLSLYAFLDWYLDTHGRHSRLVPILLFSVALAGGVLSKGLVGLLFPGAIICGFFLTVGSWSKLTKLGKLKPVHLLVSSLLFFVLAAPWHILAALHNDNFLWWYFVNEQLLRFVTTREPLDYVSISAPAFWGLALVWLFPWSAFLPAIRHLPQFRQDAKPVQPAESTDSATRAVVWLALLWGGTILIFFTLSSGRNEHYALPLLPAFAILIGFTLSTQTAATPLLHWRLEQSIARSFGFLAITGGMLGLVLTGGGAWLAQLEAGQAFAAGQSLASGGLAPASGARVDGRAYLHYFGPVFDLSPALLRQLLVPIIGTGLVLPLGTGAAWWLNRSGRRLKAILALAGMTIAFCVFAFHSMAVCMPILSSKDFALALARFHQPGDHFVVVGDFATANSINFYAPQVQIEVYRGTAYLLASGRGYPDAPSLLVSTEDLQAYWTGAERACVLVPKGESPRLSISPDFPTFPILHSGGRTLFCNHAAPTREN